MHTLRALYLGSIFAAFMAFGALYAAPAQAGLWDFLFPTKVNNAPPTADLKAPFADENIVVEDLDADGNEIIDLSARHRTSAVITQWVREIIPQFLSYKPEDYREDYKSKAVNFTTPARNEYVSFMRDQNYLTTLKAGRYRINGFVESFPVIMNEGSIDGRYRWLYRMDVMVTFIDGGADVYEDRDESDTITREYVLAVQLVRDQKADNEHGLLIESWDIQPKPQN